MERLSIRSYRVEAKSDRRGIIEQLTPYSDFAKENTPWKTVDIPWKRVYLVSSWNRGTIRGLHGHEHETKGYFVLSGVARFVSISFKDYDRSPSRSEIMRRITVSNREPWFLTFSPKIWHGWMAVEDRTTLIGFSDKTLKESEADDKRLPAERWRSVFEEPLDKY